jgi:hypothetical protein
MKSPSYVHDLTTFSDLICHFCPEKITRFSTSPRTCRDNHFAHNRSLWHTSVSTDVQNFGWSGHAQYIIGIGSISFLLCIVNGQTRLLIRVEKAVSQKTFPMLRIRTLINNLRSDSGSGTQSHLTPLVVYKKLKLLSASDRFDREFHFLTVTRVVCKSTNLPRSLAQVITRRQNLSGFLVLIGPVNQLILRFQSLFRNDFLWFPIRYFFPGPRLNRFQLHEESKVGELLVTSQYSLPGLFSILFGEFFSSSWNGLKFVRRSNIFWE